MFFQSSIDFQEIDHKRFLGSSDVFITDRRVAENQKRSAVEITRLVLVLQKFCISQNHILFDSFKALSFFSIHFSSF